MGLLDSLLGRPGQLALVGPRWRVSEVPGHLLGPANDSAAGVRVTEDSALSLSAVFCGVSLISGLIASLPRVLRRRTGARTELVTTHPAYRLLNIAPNREATAYVAWRMFDLHRLLFGCGYMEVQWAANGKPAALWPLEAWRVRPRRDPADQRLYYEVDGTRSVEIEDMLAVPLVSFDGATGRSFVEFAIESLGLGLSVQEFAARYFGNGAKPGVILKHPGSPPEKNRKEMQEAWERRHQGPQKGHRVAVMWGGWEASNEGAFDAQQSQLLDQRRFHVEEVARILNLPPFLLHELSRATWNNIEHLTRLLLMFHLGPVLTGYEQEIDRTLLEPPDLYCAHDVRAMQRGDTESRTKFYREMFGIGAYSINDVLADEDLNPVEGGDTRFVPVNMQPLERAIKGPPAPAPADPPAPGPAPKPRPPAVQPTDPPQRQSDGRIDGWRIVLESTLDRLGRVEQNALRRQADRPERIGVWTADFYRDFGNNLADALDVDYRVAQALGILPPQDCAGTAAAVAAAWCARSRAEIDELAGAVTPAGWPAAVAALAERWSARPAEVTASLLEICHVP